jgi:DNA polymerase-1
LEDREYYDKVREFRVEKLPEHVYDESENDNKFRMMKVEGLGLPVLVRSLSGLPSVDTNSIQALLESDIESHFKEEPSLGPRLRQSLNDLQELRKTNTLLNTFLSSLLEYRDYEDRIHTSININTETGRLSS